MNDLRFAFRQLAKHPGFTAVAVLTLALGIGANTAVFSVVNAVILRPLPYEQPDHLVHVWGNFEGIGLQGNQNRISPPELGELASQSRCFSQVAAIRSRASFNLTLGDLPQRIEGAYVSPSLFPLVGVSPRLGRSLVATDGEAGQSQVVVLSDGLWKRAFGADPAVVGRRVPLNGVSHEIVGVMPAGFEIVEADAWLPLVVSPEQQQARGNHGLQVLARIKPELSLEQAQADLRALTQTVVAQNPDYPYARFNFEFRLTPWHEQIVGDVKKPLEILSGAVALVLLIACANVASLLLVRASAREREVAIRLALGASRRRLFRQWLTESLLLSGVSGLMGLLFAQAALILLMHYGATVFPRIAEASLDSRVLMFTTVVSLATGALFSLAPGLHTRREVKAQSLRSGDLGLTPGRFSQRLRHALIVAEMALSLVMLTGAGLLLRSLFHLWTVESGFRPKNVLTLRVSLPEHKYADVRRTQAFYHQVLERVRSLPGVEAAGATTVLPLSGGGSSGTIQMESTAVPADHATPETDQCAVTPGYFEAMGITVLHGRTFRDQDTDQSQPVAVVDETLARTYWPNEEAVGKRLRLPGNRPWTTIVGVVRHVRSHGLDATSRIQVYWPETQATHRSLTLAIRTSVAPRSLATSVQRQIAAVDPEQPAYQIKTMEEWTQDSLALRRMGTCLLVAFAGVGLALAAMGLYGVMAYWVDRRTHELGLRVALGARQRDLLRLVTGQGLRLACFGVCFGLLGAVVVTRVLSSLLFDVRSTDPLTFLSMSLVLMGVMLLACYLPARRATKVDPMVAMRCE